MRKIENIKTKLATIPLLVILYIVMHVLNTTCIIKKILGFPCPGCGMTRAILSTIRFDFPAAFAYHPMFWSLPLLILYFLYDGRLFARKTLDTGILSGIALGFFLNWLIKLFA